MVSCCQQSTIHGNRVLDLFFRVVNRGLIYSGCTSSSLPLPQELQSRGLTLCGVLETHFHADFVSGHYELSQRVGVPVYFGPTAGKRCKFPVHELKDNEVRVLAQPGVCRHRGFVHKLCLFVCLCMCILCLSHVCAYVLQVIEFTSDYSIHVLHTPGHTMESVVYLVVDKKQDNRPLKVSQGAKGESFFKSRGQTARGGGGLGNL